MQIHYTTPAEVMSTLAEHILVDGFHVVFDPVASHGSWLVDARDGQEYLEFYTFFASAPLGHNHPELTNDPEFLADLARVSMTKVANSDIYTTHYADFVNAFTRVAGDRQLPHLFFVEGGALAVENALKVAFDWKSRLYEAAGRSRDLGTQIMHLTHAFHGRSGYTMSLTNTDPVKTDRYPKFSWPRIDAPAIKFPMSNHVNELIEAETRALAQAKAAFEANMHDIAAIIVEPIQGEGGDNHLRAEFVQELEKLSHQYEALFIVDEVQTGLGGTGSAWCYQQLGLKPDIVAFAKKVQLGGIMAGRRVNNIPDHALAVSGRLNSTWGGGLVDMVQATRILEIIERDNLFTQAAESGQYFLQQLGTIEQQFPHLVSNVRGRGLMCAMELPDTQTRNLILDKLRRQQQMLVLSSGTKSIRFRPALSVTRTEIDEAIIRLNAVLHSDGTRRNLFDSY